MASDDELFLGEWVRSLDDRHRLSIPSPWAEMLAGTSGQCVLAKERPGCLSLWNPGLWKIWIDQGVELLRVKIRSGRLDRSTNAIQMFGRLLSTRHQTAPLAGRGRLAIPESFRSFLGVEPGGEALVVGAAVCVEVWRPDAWSEHIGEHMQKFRELFDQLTD